MVLPSTALREHQPQALQGRARHLSNVVPPDDAGEARGGSPIRDRVAAWLEVRPPNERAVHYRREVGELQGGACPASTA
eukprot:3789127-Pyramimonas_sp.AAC.1